MSRYEIGEAVAIEVTIESPRAGGKEHVETWQLAVNPARDVFGLVVPNYGQISHMSYGLDYVEPLRWLAEHGKDAWWYFDAGTTRNAIKASASDLLDAFTDLSVLRRPFTIRFETTGTEVEHDDLFEVIAKADEIDGPEDEIVTIFDASGSSHDGRITRDEED